MAVTGSSPRQAEQVPVLPEKASAVHCWRKIRSPGPRDNGGFFEANEEEILTSFKARMEKAKDSVEALRAKLQADIIKGRVAQNEAEARELGYYSTSTLMRYLCHTDGDVNKAFKEIKSTVEWRKHNLPPELFVQGSKLPCCRSCAKDPRSHCFLSLGKDVLGRHIIYSNTGRAANKTPEDGIEHMASEMERLFQNSSMPGQIVWVVDLSGFGISDCNPKTGALAFPMFANHYPERFGQIVLLSFPYAFYPLYLAGQRILDKVTLAKVKILKDDQDLDRYGNAYWSHDPALHQWLNAAIKGKCTPGHFPDPKDLRCTPETESAIRQIQRCAALVEGASKA
ncbi:unnamed protein product [Effrenium voratum]|nr:unnamed protein product [Effrenium voratum]